MIFLYGLGTAFVTLAPGNFVRHTSAVSVRPGLITWIITQMEVAISSGLVWVWGTIVLVLVILLVKEKYAFKQLLSEALLFFVPILVSYAFIFVSGVSSYRVQWGIFVFSFVSLFVLLKGIHLARPLFLVFSIVLVAFVCFDFAKEYRVFNQKHRLVSEMVSRLETNSLVDGDVFLWPYIRETRKSIPDPVGENGNWPGEYVAQYYQTTPFRIIPEDAYAYCQGKIDAESLVYGSIPCIAPYAFFKLEESNNWQVTVKYNYPEGGYVFRNMIARLMKAGGKDLLSRHVFSDPSQIVGGKWLLEKMEAAFIEKHVDRKQSQYNSFFFDGAWYVVVPQKDLSAPYDAPDMICTVE